MSEALKIQNHPFLSKEFIQAFVQAVIKTHHITANAEILPEKPFVSSEYTSHGEVVGFVGIVANDMKWVLSIAYSKKSATDLFMILFGEQKETLDKDVVDFVGEMTNQVYGAAKTVLNQRGFKFEMALPTVIAGSFSAKMTGAGTTLTIPFKVKSTQSDLWIDITLEKTK